MQRGGVKLGKRVKLGRRVTYRVTRAAAAAVALAVMAAGPAAAQEGEFLALSLGGFDIARDDTATEARVEYRLDDIGYNIGPMVGVMFNSDASVYFYGGFFLDFEFGNWVVMPNLAVGAYVEGNGKDLGHVVEFRSGVELAYRFDDRSRLGIAFSHISNANLGERNPGAGSLVVTYAIHLDRLWYAVPS